MSPASIPLPKLDTAPDVAEELNLSLPHLYKLVREDQIPHVRLGRSVRFDRRAVREWIDTGGTNWTPPGA